jgi:DNA-binding HxlR family transcriptional regulator
MIAKAKKIPRAGIGAARMVEDIIGLTAKVLNERLRKLLRFGIIEREVFAEVPPRVEYRLTAFGRRFDGVLGEIAALDAAREE